MSYVLLQIALDTFYWNPIMHVFVWGSILVWFLIIPITSTGLLYGSFFQYVGVAYEVMSTANFWFYLPLSAVVALLPTIFFRLLKLYRYPTYVDFVRLKERKEGKKLFKRKKIDRKSRSAHSMKRSGYAFAQEQGFGHLISTGHIFGMDEGFVAAERTRRNSTFLSASSSRPDLTPSALAAATVSISAAAVHLAKPTAIRFEVEEAVEVLVAASDGNQNKDDDDPSSFSTVMETIRAEQANVGVAITVVATERPAEETDSALIAPSLRIPGLVDSSMEGTEDGEEKTVEPGKSGDQEGSSAAELEAEERPNEGDMNVV